MKQLLAAVLFVATSLTLSGQAPHHDWRTLETENFRIHYPKPYEAWATRAASTLESVRSRVGAAVGFTSSDRIDVVVTDPQANANGSAWPIFGWPRMVLWTTPPPPNSSIGTGRDWIEMLTVHEQTHLDHLLRPSRNPMRRIVETVLPLGGISFAPRWVSEGYATVIEGELTGAGRPNSDLRASLLRKWAQMGRLPSYTQLDSDAEHWQGMSMAYLTGSAYLEWLQARSGPDGLRHLWARMTARQRRTFDESFLGVFGDSPQALYDRFRAETTARAMTIEPLVASSLREGDLFQDLSWSTGGPSISPDGNRVAVVRRSRDDAPRITVWKIEDDGKAQKEFDERIAKIIERDPQDVAPRRSRPLPRDPEWELELPNSMQPYGVEWLSETSLIFTSDEPDSDGFLHADLFEWNAEGQNVRRITRLADVRDAHPHPAGAKAVATRSRYGATQLVEVDLETGALTELTPPLIDSVLSSPQWNRDGSRILYLAQERGRWRLQEMTVRGGAARELSSPEDSHISSASWSRDGQSVYATLGRAGFLEIWRRDSVGQWSQLTRSSGAALEPAASDDRLFFLSLDADGLDLRSLALSDLSPLPSVTIDASLAPVVRPLPRTAPQFEVATMPPSRPYGAGRQELLPLAAASLSPSGQSLEAGIRVGDLLGRLDTVILGSAGDRGSQRGFAASSIWRGLPVAIGAHLFSTRHDLSRQPESGGAAHDLEQTGGELRLEWDRQSRTGAWSLEGGLLSQRLLADEVRSDQTAAFVGGQHSWSYEKSHHGISEQLSLRFDSQHGDTSSTITGAKLELGAFLGDLALLATVERAESSDSPLLLGGVASSILPRSARSARMISEALPIGVLSGQNFERQRLDLATGLLPFGLFFERSRMWDGGEDQGDWLQQAGVEISVAFDAFPLLRIPALEARLGAARILDAPLEGETNWWLTMVWRP